MPAREPVAIGSLPYKEDEMEQKIYPIQRQLVLGCTAARHHSIGIDAVINARGGEQWRNDFTDDDRALANDARHLRAHQQQGLMVFNVYARFFRRHKSSIQHMLTSYEDVYASFDIRW